VCVVCRGKIRDTPLTRADSSPSSLSSSSTLSVYDHPTATPHRLHFRAGSHKEPGPRLHIATLLHIIIASSVDPRPPTPDASVGAVAGPPPPAEEKTEGAGDKAPMPGAAAAKADGGGWWCETPPTAAADSMTTPAGMGTAAQEAWWGADRPLVEVVVVVVVSAVGTMTESTDPDVARSMA